MDIIEFAQSIQYPLYPVQAVVLKLLYRLRLSGEEKDFWGSPDGVPIRMSEVEYAQILAREGRSNHLYAGEHPKTLLWIGGRRGGRTHVLVLVTLYEVWKLLQIPCPQATRDLPAETPLNALWVGSPATFLREKFSRFDDMRYLEPFQNRLANKASGYLALQTDKDIEDTGTWKGSQRKARGSIHIHAKAPIPRGMRGPVSFLVVVDDLEWLPRSSFMDTLDALDPCVRAWGGLTVISSSGGDKSSNVWKLHEACRKVPDTLCIQTPTWEMAPNIPWKFLREHEGKDPLVFRTDFGAELVNEVSAPASPTVVRELQSAAERRGVPLQQLVEDILTDWVLRNGGGGWTRTSNRL